MSNPLPEELQIFACHHIIDLHKLRYSWRFYQFSSSSLRFKMILIFSIFSMNLSKNNQNTVILKIIEISGNCHGRFTANYSKFLASHSIHKEMWYNFAPAFLKIWKIWALCSRGVVNSYKGLGKHAPARIMGKLAKFCQGYCQCFVNFAFVMVLLYGDLHSSVNATNF